MENKKLIWIAVVVIVIIGIIFLLNRDGINENDDTTLSDEVVSEVPATLGEDVEEMIVSGDTKSENTPDEGGTSDEEAVSDEAVVEEETSETKFVTYTDSGFSPEIIQVKAGDTVTFVNNSSRNMWVASVIHPTHTLYPEKSDSDCLGSTFDTCTSIQSGESWSFTFGKVGSWKYHNHLSAGRTGVVEVQ